MKARLGNVRLVRLSASRPELVPSGVHHRSMANGRVRCLFCYEDSGDNLVASSEHLLSRPVAAAFGIDRRSSVARVDGDVEEIRWMQLNGIKRRCVCTRCNNGWMNRLEHSMAGIATWISGPIGEPIGAARALDLRNWALKTHMLLCFIEGNAGRFGEDTFTGEYVVPPVTPAKALYKGDHNALAHCVVGVTRSTSRTDFAWSFGTPSVTAPGGVKGHPRFAPVSIVTVGSLQLWVVVPLLPARVTMPAGVQVCRAGLRPDELARTGHPMNLGLVRVDFE